MRYLWSDNSKKLDVLVFSDKDDRVSLNCSEICPPVGLKETGDHFSVAREEKISVERLQTARLKLFKSTCISTNAPAVHLQQTMCWIR